MKRLITRYRGGSRKLYDTTDSRYVSLDEIPEMIRGGDVLRVVDNSSGADVTAQVLTQVISEGERRGVSFLSAESLHEIIRRGERVLASGLHQLQRELDHLVSASVGRLRPTRGEPRELAVLRSGLRRLERSLALLADRRPRPPHHRKVSRRVRSARPQRTDSD